MDCLWGSVVLQSTKVLDHTNGRIITDLLAPLADGALTRAAGDSVIPTTVAIAFATQGLPLFLSRFSVTRTSSTNVHGIRVSG